MLTFMIVYDFHESVQYTKWKRKSLFALYGQQIIFEQNGNLKDNKGRNEFIIYQNQ